MLSPTYVMIVLLTGITLIGATLNNKGVFVDGNGMDSETCGSKEQPCKTISYIIQDRHPNSPLLHIRVLSVVHENHTVVARRSQYIVMEGVNKSSSVLNVNGSHLFDISYARDLNISFTFTNLIINIRSEFLKLRAYDSIAEVKMTNITLRDTYHQLSHRSMLIYAYMNNRHRTSNECGINLMINGCKISNLRRNRGIVFVINAVRCKSHITISATDTSYNRLWSFALVRSRYSLSSIHLTNLKALRNRMFYSLIHLQLYDDRGFDIFMKGITYHDNIGKMIWTSIVQKISAKTMAARIMNLSEIHAEQNFGSVLKVQYRQLCKLSDSKCVKTKKTAIVVTVDSSSFARNVAIVQGGAAIFARTNSYSSTIQLTVKWSSFSENEASSGGAILSNAQTIIHDSDFAFNYAETGGAIKLFSTLVAAKRTDTKYPGIDKLRVNSVSNSNFTTSCVALDTSTNLNIGNLNINLFDEEEDESLAITELLHHESSSQFLEITGPLRFDCGINQNAVNRTRRAKFEGEPNSNEPAGEDSRFFSLITVLCHQCPKGSYSIREGIATWSEETRSFTGSQNECLPCPYGGDCTEGAIRSRIGYWGFVDQEERSVQFVRCPDGYCSDESNDIDSCNINRTGTLCGECKSNTLLSVTSSRCLDAAHCNVSSTLYIVGIFPLITALFITIVIFQEKFKSFFQQIWTALKSRFVSSCDSNEDHDSGGTFTFAQFTLVITFYQLQSLIYVSNKVITPVWVHMQETLGMIAMLNFVSFDELNDLTQYCFPASITFTFIHRSFMNIFFNILPIMLSFIVYVIICVYEKFGTPKDSLKFKLLSALFHSINIFYIPLVSNLFQLVACVDIVHEGEERSVLISQGDIICYVWWQYVVIFVIAVYVVWYSAFLYVAPIYLRKYKYKDFLAMTFVPISTLYFFLKLVCDKKKTSYDILLPLPEDDLDSSEEEETSRLIKASTRSISLREQNNNNKHQGSSQAVKKSNGTYAHCQKLVQLLQSESRYSFWQSITVLQELFAAVIPVLFHHDHTQILALLVILLPYSFLLVRLRPHRDDVMNMLEPTLMAMLLFLGVCGIINTTFLTSTDDNIRHILVIIDYIKVVLLTIPVPMLISFVFINRLLKRNTREHDIIFDVTAR